MVEAPDTREEIEHPGGHSTGMNRGGQDQRIRFEDGLKVGAQAIVNRADIGFGTEMGTASTRHEIKAAQIDEGGGVATLFKK